MWLHDEENVEAAADAMKRPLSTLRSARRGTSLQLRVGDRLDELAGSVPGAQRRNTILKPVVTEPSICTVLGAWPKPRSASQLKASVISAGFLTPRND